MPNTVYSGPDTEPCCTKYTSNISEPTHSDFDSDSDEDTAGSNETVASQGKAFLSGITSCVSFDGYNLYFDESPDYLYYSGCNQAFLQAKAEPLELSTL